MFCPQCQAEYRPGFVRCSDCDVELVDHLEEREPAEAHSEQRVEVAYDDYVVVSTAQGPFEEGQVCSFLEAYGIPTQIRGEGVRKAYGITLDGIGASKILVPRELEATARDLLARADQGELKIDEA